MRLTQGPTFFICGVVISARQKFALVFSLIFSLNTLLPAVSLWYGLVQRNAPNPCSTRLSGIVWYGLVRADMAFGQIRPVLFVVSFDCALSILDTAAAVSSPAVFRHKESRPLSEPAIRLLWRRPGWGISWIMGLIIIAILF